MRGGWRSALVFLLALGTAAPAVEPADVSRAVERGVAALRALQGGGGTWTYGSEVGATALAGLTLLECGVRPDDPAVARAARAVRAAAPALTHTYSLALAVLFLDRLGEPDDVPLVQVLGLRLVAGQGATGGWGYQCPPVGDAAALARLRQSRPRSEGSPAGLTPDEVRLLLQNSPPRGGDTASDNSNTQFATLALWVARRHGVPVDGALRAVSLRFRGTQNADGGWAYTGGGGGIGSTATMTAAGVLCLAVADGAALDRRKPAEGKTPQGVQDRNLQLGLLALSTAVGHPAGVRRSGDLPVGVPRAGGKSYYFLWSLERVCVVLGLEKLGGKDWYTWGAEILLFNQQADGSWQGEYGNGGVDTCFALLFLVRSNVARDLTTRLRGRWRDSEVTLKSGGVGGESLVGGKAKFGLKPAIEPGGKSADGSAPADPARPAAPLPDRDTEAGRLAADALAGPAGRRGAALEKLRDGKGVEFTEALAAVIPRLGDDDRKQARQLFAERLSRMKDSSLARYLKDPDAEIRRAAALALAMRDSRAHVPDLIELLRDSDPDVVAGAHGALRALTGNEGLGPDAAAWKEWWAKRR